MNGKFGVFILSHGRADNVITYKSLRKQNYTGDIYILVDNEDEQIDMYKRKYGDKVIVFNKLEQAKKTDSGDLSDDRRVILYARNRCFDEAERLGLDYFLELDDDYVAWEIRWRQGEKLMTAPVCSLDGLFERMIDFLETTNATTVAVAQGGDFIGGANGGLFNKGIARKAMNTFFCKTNKRFNFVGRINEDVNTYTTLGQKGEKIFTFTEVDVRQKKTQSNSGGMTDVYLDKGTFLKSFYSVMYSPSCVKIALMGDKHKRIHHSIKWENCTPMILNEKWKKGVNNGR